MAERFPFGPSTRPECPFPCLQGFLDPSSPSRSRFAALRAHPEPIGGMAVQERKGGTAARWEQLAQTSDFATTGDSHLGKNAASSSQEIKYSANSGAATGQKHSGRGRLTCCCPAAGRQLSKHSVHWAGIASRPYTAPRTAPQIAALVPVSPPRITVFTTPTKNPEEPDNEGVAQGIADSWYTPLSVPVPF